MSTNEGMIYDLDGTLVDGTEAIKMEVFFECIRSFRNEDLIGHWFDNHAYSPEEIYQRGSNTRERLQLFASLDPSNSQIVEKFIAYHRSHRSDMESDRVKSSTVRLYSEADAVLATSSEKYKQGVLTDAHASLVEKVFGALPVLTQRFDLLQNVITQNDVENRKPHTEGILKLMEQLWILPENTSYIDDKLPWLQAAVAAEVERIYWLDREGKTSDVLTKELKLLVNTGRVVRARTLDVLLQPRIPIAVIMSGRQWTWKSLLLQKIRYPGAFINKDCIAEKNGWNWEVDPEYRNRDPLYVDFTEAALSAIRKYWFVCLDAPFTRKDDIDGMIRSLQKKFPNIPVIVVRVTAPKQDIQRRMQGRKTAALIGYERVPTNDIFDTNFEDEPFLNSSLPEGVQFLKLDNPNGQKPEKTLEPLHDLLSRFLS